MTTMKKYREASILMVDDNDVDVMAMRRALISLKILNPIVRAQDGVEALELLRDRDKVKRPYIILLDLDMPRMNGLEFLAALRKDPELSSSVVFVLTTSNSDEDKLQSYGFNIAGYIVKADVGHGFMNVMSLLDHYWRVVELPVSD
jgi:CheY-like chemotaxis protein